MDTKYSAFSFKDGNTVFHKMPAWIKLIFIPVFNVLIFSLDWKAALFFAVFQFFLMLFSKFTVREQAADLVPVLWYGILIYALEIFTEFFTNLNSQGMIHSFLWGIKKSLKNEKNFSVFIKFFACTQSASLMFKTSTSLSIRKGIEIIERKIRLILPVKKECSLSPMISMFINFIPGVFKLWNELKKAWIARGGKVNLKMFLKIFPSLFFLGLKNASDTAKAITARTKK